MDSTAHAGQQLGEVVDRIHSLPSMYERTYALPTSANSVRAADDQASGGLTIGHFVQYCLAQSVDACVGIEKLVTNDRGLEIPLSATYPLARTAIESSCMALWAMNAATRRERVLRRLQIAQDELRYEKKFSDALSLTQDPRQREATRRAHSRGGKQLKRQMAEIAAVNHIDAADYQTQLPGWESIVNAAGSLFNPESPAMLVTTWKLTSGLTHPSYMRGLVAHQFEESGGSGLEAIGVLRGDVNWIASTAHVAEVMTRRAIVKLRLSKAQIDGERPTLQAS